MHNTFIKMVCMRFSTCFFLVSLRFWNAESKIFKNQIVTDSVLFDRKSGQTSMIQIPDRMQ